MTWLGFATILTIYWCIFAFATSSRWGWLAICMWLVPIVAMTISHEAGMEINGLMILIGIIMFLVCRRSMLDLKMWNTKIRKQHSILFAMLYIVIILMFEYIFAVAQIQGYLLNIQGIGSEYGSSWTILLTAIPMLSLSWVYTQMVYTTIDRLYCKKKSLILLACQIYISNESSLETKLLRGYFLEGVQNGVTYHFKMTRRVFFMLQHEKVLQIPIKVGLFGGQYVTELQAADREKKKLHRMDTKAAQFGVLGCCMVVALVIWLFW